jgi:hypothetical protein
METIVLWTVFLVSLLAIVFIIGGVRPVISIKENFASSGLPNLQSLSMEALDRAPSTSEVKDSYKLLLVYSNASIRKGGQDSVQALRVLADLRDRLFDIHDFREDLTVEMFMADWPNWLPPIDPTITEPTHTCADAATAESRVLAYLQRYFPQEQNVDEQTGSTIRNLIQDFGSRFVFPEGAEVVLADGFLRTPLLRGWTNPCSRPT